MGRGLSSQQIEILDALAKAGEPIPIVDLAEIYWAAFDQDELDRRFRAGEFGAFDRDRTFAGRRAVDGLERRGLVRVVWVEVEWERQMWNRRSRRKTERLLAAEIAHPRK